MLTEENSEKFMKYFSEIEEHLQDRSEAGGFQPFGNLLNIFKDKDSTIKFYYDELQHIKNIRNLIVHNHEYYAVPNERTLNLLKKIRDKLLDPPTVYPLFEKDVLVVEYTRSVVRTVKSMNRHSYTQVPVLDESKEVMGLLTDKTVSRWLGDLEFEEEKNLILPDTSVEEVLAYTKEDHIYDIIGPDVNLAAVLDKFNRAQRRGQRLDALLIADKRDSGQELLGIITPWDIPVIYEELNEV